MNSLILAQNVSDLLRQGVKPLRPGMGPFAIMVVQIAIIALALVILWWMLRGHYRKSRFSKDDTPLDILKKRYAAGELTKEEYEGLKKDIGA